jgi:hypothetical protein
MNLPVLRRPFRGPLLLLLCSDASCFITRDTQFLTVSIHPSRSLLFRPRATRDLYQIASHLSRQGLHPLPVDLFSHTGALAGILPQSHAVFLCGRVCGCRGARGKRKNWVGWLLR